MLNIIRYQQVGRTYFKLGKDHDECKGKYTILLNKFPSSLTEKLMVLQFLVSYLAFSCFKIQLLPCKNQHGHLILNFSLRVCTLYHLVTMATPDS